MPGFVLRWAVSAVGLWIAAALVPGVRIEGTGTLLLAAALLGLVNAFVRPLVILLTLPATLLSLGLFLLVVNAAMFGLVAALLEGFRVAGFGSAFLGALIVSFVSWIVSVNVGSSVRRIDVVVMQRHSHRPGRD